MAVTINMSIKNKLIDIHTHVLNEVDDGSKSLDMSLMMLKKMANDGVSDVVLTPHIQSSVTFTSRAEQINKYEKLISAAHYLHINIHLGAEIRYRSHLKPDLSMYGLAGSKYILMEFSPYQEEPIEEVLYNMIKKGYKPILAHCERYEYLDFEDYQSLNELGVLLQSNADATMGLTSKREHKLILKLLKNELISLIASDTHRIDKRPPNLKEAYDYLLKKIDSDYLHKIFYDYAYKIIYEGNE